MATKIYEKIPNIDFLNLDEWNFQELLASSNNSVYSYTSKNDDTQRIAVKEINYKPEHQEELFQKLQIIQKIKNFQHDNIIEIYGAAKVIKRKMFGEDLSIVIGMEQADGNLEDYVRMKIKNQDVFSEIEIHLFVNDVLNGMNFLQKHMIAHRDIKPENILIKDNKFKLGDLDDLKYKGNKTEEKTVVLGTFVYSAPEILKAMKKEQPRMYYNAYKADLFSFGLCLFYISSLKKFTAKERFDLPKDEFNRVVKNYRKQIKQNYESGVLISKTIKSCLVVDPFLRSDISQLYKTLVEKGLIEDDVHKISPSFVKERQNFQDYLQDQTANNISQDITPMYTPSLSQNSSFQGSSLRNTLSLSQINKIQKNFNQNKNKNKVQDNKTKELQTSQTNYNTKKGISNATSQMTKTQNNSYISQMTGAENDSYEDEGEEQYIVYNQNISQVYSQNALKTNKTSKASINTVNNNNTSKPSLSQSQLKSQIRFKSAIEEINNTQTSISSLDNLELSEYEKPNFTRKQKIAMISTISIIMFLLILAVVWIFKAQPLQCKPNQFIQVDQCVETCMVGTYGNSQSLKCEPCIDNCTQCNSKRFCQVCSSNYIRNPFGSSCIRQIHGDGESDGENVKELQNIQYNLRYSRIEELNE